MQYRRLFLLLLTSIVLVACGGGGGGAAGGAGLPNTVLLQDTGYAQADDSDVKASILSPDGRFLYISVDRGYFEENRIHIYQDTGNGFVERPEYVSDECVIRLVMSSDGKHLYAYGDGSNNSSPFITAYSRNSATGVLTRVAKYNLGNFAQNFVITPDGSMLYTTNTNSLNASIFARNANTGELNNIGTTTISSNKEILIFSNDSLFAYSEGLSGFDIYSRDLVTGQLVTLGNMNSGGSLVNVVDVASMKMGPDGLLIYASGDFSTMDNGGQPSIKRGVLAISRDTTTGLLSYLQFISASDTQTPLFSVDPPGKLELSRNGDFVMVADTVTSILNGVSYDHDTKYYIFDRDAGTGVLSLNQTYQSTLLKFQPVFHMNDNYLLANHEFNGYGVMQFALDSVTGSLSNEVSLHLSNEYNGLDGADASLLSRDGQYLYVSGRAEDFSINVFAQNQTSGELTFVQNFKMRDPLYREFSVLSLIESSDGLNLYVTGLGGTVINNKSATSGVIVLDRDPTTGMISFNQNYNAGLFNLAALGEFYHDIVSSRDGKYYYTSGVLLNGNAGIVVLERGSGGVLSIVETVDLLDPASTVSGYDGFFRQKARIRLAISADGSNLYCLNRFDESINVIDVNTNNGTLSANDYYFDGLMSGNGDEIDGLREGSSIVVSPDGSNVYVAADEIYSAIDIKYNIPTNTVSLISFSRQQSTGKLSLIQKVQRGGADPAGTLYDVQGGSDSLVINTTGTQVYVRTRKVRSILDPVADNGIGVDVFSRDNVTGMLEFKQRLDTGRYGLGVSSVSTDSNNMFVFSTNELLGTVSVIQNIGN